MIQRLTVTKKICIIGFGPTAQAFIASMMQKAGATPDVKYEITVIEQRNANFQRRQRLVDIKPGVLLAEESWESFLAKITKIRNRITENGDLLDDTSAPIVNLNARQKFLRKLFRQSIVALCRQIIVKNFSIKSLQKALFEQIESTKLENVSVNLKFETMVDSINLTNKKLTIRSSKEIDQPSLDFDTLIICEGCKRNFTKQINEAVLKENINIPIFDFESFPYQLPMNNAACLLTVNSFDRTKTRSYFYLSTDDYRAKLAALGWKSPNGNEALPTYIVDNNMYKDKLSIKEWKRVVFVASEIPEEISEINDLNLRKQKVMAWIKAIASYQLQLPEECFDVSKCKDGGDEFDSLTMFETNTQYVKQPVMILPNNAEVLLLGDCSMSSLYQAGYSSCIGLNEAIIVADCILARNKDSASRFELFSQAYQAYQQNIGRLLENSQHSRPYLSQIRFFEKSMIGAGKINLFRTPQPTAFSN